MPLYIAAQNGHLEVVQFLVKSGANKDEGRTSDGATPLYTAAQKGHLEVVRFLVESGANKDPQGQTDMMEQRLFSLQLRKGTLKLSDFWLSRVPTKTKAGQMMEQRLFPLQLRKGTLKLSDFWLSRVPTKTKAGQMMEQRLFTLSIAAQEGHLDAVQFLVEVGANQIPRRDR